jgi:hypothetical protein
MGYYITYSLTLRIRAQDVQKALDIFNYLHTDEMLTRYARGGSYPQTGAVSDCHWYSWVNNPKKPYETLTEAFGNWCIVENNVVCTVDTETQDFIVSGDYDNKWGQQDFLIEQLAPVLNDTEIHVTGEDRTHYVWTVKDHVYSSSSYTNEDDEDEDEDEDEEGEDNGDPVHKMKKFLSCHLGLSNTSYLTIDYDILSQKVIDELKTLKQTAVDDDDLEFELRCILVNALFFGIPDVASGTGNEQDLQDYGVKQSFEEFKEIYLLV